MSDKDTGYWGQYLVGSSVLRIIGSITDTIFRRGEQKDNHKVQLNANSKLPYFQEDFIMTYENHDDIIKDMQPIFDSCAKKDNGIDGIAFLVGPAVQGRSRVPGFGGEFDATLAPQLFGTFDETTKEKLAFDSNTTLQYVCFMNKHKETGEMEVWTLATVFSTYQLVFAGKLEKGKEHKLFIHQSTVTVYIEKLLPLIKEYERVI
ncbi:MAG: hypothetical protein SWX82_32350 [Cyanobacteriota bacterium]|nr:hypothetical protein [Cyanobacteriota bacterium]